MSALVGCRFLDEQGRRVVVERVWRGHRPDAWSHLPHDFMAPPVLWPRRVVRVRVELVPPGAVSRVGGVLVRPFKGLRRVGR